MIVIFCKDLRNNQSAFVCTIHHLIHHEDSHNSMGEVENHVISKSNNQYPNTSSPTLIYNYYTHVKLRYTNIVTILVNTSTVHYIAYWGYGDGIPFFAPTVGIPLFSSEFEFCLSTMLAIDSSVQEIAKKKKHTQ